MKVYYRVAIVTVKNSDGFNFRVCAPETNGHADQGALVDETEVHFRTILYRLDDPELPEAIPDIRGQVRDEPETLYGYHDGDKPRYLGIVERERTMWLLDKGFGDEEFIAADSYGDALADILQTCGTRELPEGWTIEEVM